MTYTARPGSVPARAISALAKAGEPLTRQQLGTALGCNPDHVDAHLATPVKLGAILRNKDFGTTRWALPAGSKPDQGKPPIATEAADDKPTATSKPRKAKPAVIEKTSKPKARRKAKRTQRKARAAVVRKRVKRAPVVKRARARPAKEVLPPPVAEEIAQADLPAFGLYSDGTLAMERAGERVFSIPYVDTLLLIKYLISQKALVDELFPESGHEG